MASSTCFFSSASPTASSSSCSFGSGGAALAASSASLRLRASSLALAAWTSRYSLSFSEMTYSREWKAWRINQVRQACCSRLCLTRIVMTCSRRTRYLSHFFKLSIALLRFSSRKACRLYFAFVLKYWLSLLNAWRFSWSCSL